MQMFLRPLLSEKMISDTPVSTRKVFDMKFILYSTLVILHLFSFAAAADYSPAAASLLKKAESQCAGFESGQFHMEDSAVST